MVTRHSDVCRAASGARRGGPGAADECVGTPEHRTQQPWPDSRRSTAHTSREAAIVAVKMKLQQGQKSAISTSHAPMRGGHVAHALQGRIVDPNASYPSSGR